MTNILQSSLTSFLENYFISKNENFLNEESFQNCYLGLYPEFFLIITLSFLIAFLVIIDYNSNHKVILTTVAGKILIVIYFLLS